MEDFKEKLPSLVIFTLTLIFFLLPLNNLKAQDLIALHPFRGESADSEIAVLFFEGMVREVPRAGNVEYRVFSIDLNNLPPDVPPGGFPPWISPSPSITRDAAFAITGEATPDLDFEGSTRIRLYLWRLEGARLLGSDEITLFDADDLVTLNAFLAWVLSWIEDFVPPEPEIIRPWVYEPNWLYLGVRAGGGYSRWTYDLRDTSVSTQVTSFISINMALQATVFFTSYFGLQTEIQFNTDFSTNDLHGNFRSMGLTFPLLVKFVLRGERLKTGFFGGISLYLPISESGQDESLAYYHYEPDFPGFVFGMNTGWRLGPGNIFFDLRFEYDLHWTNPHLNQINYRSAARFSLGYDMGFFPKNRN